jgi:hypothetical protein
MANQSAKPSAQSNDITHGQMDCNTRYGSALALENQEGFLTVMTERFVNSTIVSM